MIEQEAQVTQVEGNQVWMSVQRKSACQHCNLNEGCGTGSLGRLMGYRNTQWTFPNKLGLKKGDRVVLSIPDQSYLLGSALVYILPLFAFFLSAAIVELIWHIEWLTVIVSLISLVAGFIFSGRLSRHRFADDLQPKILRQIL